jgi:hypothetical protein
MLRRFGLRRILPLSFFALHVLLSFYGYYHQPVAGRLARHASSQKRLSLAKTETALAWDIDIAINLPAFVCGFIIVLLTRTGSNLSSLICASPFVLILWFLIGRWGDWQLGWVSALLPKRVLQGISIAGIVLTGMSLLLLVAGMPLSGTSESGWPAITLACWTLFLLGISVISLVRPEPKQKRSPKAAL